MLTIETIGHDDRYSVEQSALMLLLRDVEGHCVSRMSVRGDVHIATTKISLPHLKRVCRTQAAGVCQRKISATLPTHEQKRLRRELVRESFYRAYVAAAGERPLWGSLTGVKPAKVASKLLEAHKSPQNVLNILQKRYHLTPDRAELCLSTAQASRAYQATLQPNDISVYIAIPFCPTRCNYCSFVSQSTESETELIEPYLSALYREIEQKSNEVAANEQRIVNLYIGGGTPTVLTWRQLDALLLHIARHFNLTSLREYTVEAGRPETCDIERLRVLKFHGVTRVSVNPQTMRQPVLDAIGRRHTVEYVYLAVESVRHVGFDVLNMDVIAGLPSDDANGFTATLDIVRGFDPENITMHSFARKKGSIVVGDVVHNVPLPLKFQNYTPYYLYRLKYSAGTGENIGYCKPGTECGYNICMMDELHTVIGIGAGAASKIHGGSGKISRVANKKYPIEYIRSAL